MAKWDNPIGIPFAESGDRDAIPDTSESGNVNNTTGFGSKYETDPAVGGLWLYRQTMNSLFYNLFSSIKEIQTKVPISVNGTTPDVSGNISIPIPVADNAGIKIIDDNTPDITDFNQITEDGIYYIYKKLLNAFPYEEVFGAFTVISLIVINVKNEEYDLNLCIQLVSSNIDYFGLVPSNIGVLPLLRSYDKNTQQWGDWFNRNGIIFIKNNIAMEEFNTTNKSNIMFPIIAKDAYESNGPNNFMYAATKDQMREQLGIKDPVEPVDTVEKWKTYTPSMSNGSCLSAMYRIYDSEINDYPYRRISIMAILSADITLNNVSLYSFSFSLPENIKVYNNGVALKSGGMASIIYSLTGMNVAETGGKAVNASACYSKSNGNILEMSYTLFGTFSGSTVQSAVLTFQIDALIDDRTVAPTPASIAVTKIIGNSVTLTYTRGK